MLRQILIISSLILIMNASVFPIDKPQAKLKKIGDVVNGEIRVRPSLTLAEPCIVRHDQGIIMQIDGWVIGNELYKSYLDPSLSCSNPYPYQVTEVNMPMVFAAATVLNVSVDIEAVDYTSPNCPVPDTIIAISSSWELNVPGPGLYDIWIPFDAPVEVNEPFFAGFFIGNVIDASAGAAVVSDTNTQALCYSYNIWDENLGFVDLLNNQFWNFPGQLVLYVTGSPGGNPGGNQPAPTMRFVNPVNNDILLGSSEIWIEETSGSNIIDYTVFEYSDGSQYIEIIRDYDGTKPFRNGIDPAENGTGYTALWNFSFLPEGVRKIRATVYDTLGRTAADEITVLIEPTPPNPTIVEPNNMTNICTNLDFLFQNFDENVVSTQLFHKKLDINYSAGLNTIDINNHSVEYSAAISAALLMNLWSDRGYTSLMREGLTTMPIDTVVNRLAALFGTPQKNGDYDERVFLFLKEYIRLKGSYLKTEYIRNPDYMTLRENVEEQEKGVMIALGGTPGFWLAVDGFVGWTQYDGTFIIKVSDPNTNSILNISLRETVEGAEVNYNGTWQKIDLMITTVGKTWKPSRVLIGSDTDNSNGWQINWTPEGLQVGAQYYFRAESKDASALIGASTYILTFDCSGILVNGDFNDDALVDINDLSYLIDYYLNGGPAPNGGVWRADTNCDNYLNITDIVFFANVIFGTSGPPCH